jgi:hypothetical protein
MQSVIDFVLGLILAIFGFVMSFIGIIDGAVTDDMTRGGIDSHLQFVIIIVITVLLVVAALRLVGGLLGWLVLVLLALLLLHHAIPDMMQAGWQPGLQGHYF